MSSSLVSMTMARGRNRAPLNLFLRLFCFPARFVIHCPNERPRPASRFVIYGFRLINFSLIFVSSAIPLKLSASSADKPPRLTLDLQRFYNAISIVKSRGEWTNNNVRERKFFYKNLLGYLDSSRRDRWNKIKSLRRIVDPSRGGTKGYPLEGRERGRGF